MWRLFPAALLAACYGPSFPEGLECSERGQCPEGQTCDPSTNRCWSLDASPCVGDALPLPPRNLERCAIPSPQGDVVLPDGAIVIDTSAGTITAGDAPVEGISVALVTQTDGGTPALVLSARDFTVPATTQVTVRGSRPLAIVALGTILVDGTIDASANGGDAGPGADLACATGAGTPGITRQTGIDWGGTGGGGGGHGTAGAPGGDIAPAPAAPVSVPGGAPWGDLDGPLLGGCSGGGGGVGFAGDPPPRGGGGGGGLALIAADTIAITGVVSVSGGGGAGGVTESAGGGGGGAGGKLVVQAWTVTLSGARLTANGGAGGEGRFEIQAAGNGGGDGAIDTDVAAGGGGGGPGGDGGAGATGIADPTAGGVGAGGMDMPAGGGGGGGGVGKIVIDTRAPSITDALISPPSVMP
jgi:hypothetical protein